MVNTYSYAPYGASLAKAETALVANPWQYAGGFYDSESGLYLMGARYYDPSIGRFLQQDPLGGGSSSQYTYASGDPCNNGDPSGLTTCYHFVNSSTITFGIHALQEEVTALNIAAATVGGTAGVTFGLPPVSAGMAGFALGLLFRANQLAGWPGTLQTDGQFSPDGTFRTYQSTGANVQYSSTQWVFFDAPCRNGDSTTPVSGYPIVSGDPWSIFFP